MNKTLTILIAALAALSTTALPAAADPGDDPGAPALLQCHVLVRNTDAHASCTSEPADASLRMDWCPPGMICLSFPLLACWVSVPEAPGRCDTFLL